MGDPKLVEPTRLQQASESLLAAKSWRAAVGVVQEPVCRRGPGHGGPRQELDVVRPQPAGWPRTALTGAVPGLEIAGSLGEGVEQVGRLVQVSVVTAGAVEVFAG
jgi:hypothetical protein